MAGDSDYPFWLYVGLAAFVFAILLGRFWWKSSTWLVPRAITCPKDRAELADSNRKTIAQFLGGLGFIATFFFTIYQFQTQHHQSVSQQANQQFVDAAKLLAEKGLGTQAAGFHAMGNLAASRKEYMTPVLQTITSYLRGREPAASASYPGGVSKNQTDYPGEISPEVHAAIFVLNGLVPPEGVRVDLRHAYLVHANFGKAQFAYREADFSGATLYGAVFKDADLTGASFDGSSMADWEAYDLEATNYKEVWWDHVVYFDGANLKGATFDHVWIGKTSFEGACLANVRFQDADLSRADFRNSDLGDGALNAAGQNRLLDAKNERKPADCVVREGGAVKKAGFFKARLKNADFRGVNAANVDFKRAKLHNANFAGADISGALFCGANLSETDFSQARNVNAAYFKDCPKRDATEEDVGGACTQTGAHAKFPEGMKAFEVCAGE